MKAQEPLYRKVDRTHIVQIQNYNNYLAWKISTCYLFKNIFTN